MITDIAKYRAFLKAKARIAQDLGFHVPADELHPMLKPHQRDAVLWAVQGGRRAIFAKFGLGKTFMQLEAVRLTLLRCGGRGLIVLPLGVRQEFKRDAATLGIDVKFIRTIGEAEETGIYLTNYETVRDGKLDPAKFSVASLDEAACLRGFGGTKTFREFMRLFENVPYRFVATATPSPNDYIEILAYSAFLGVMDVGEAKTRFFKRDSTKADVLTIHPHKTQEFWLWVASWALFLQRPSDLCGGSVCRGANISKGRNSASSLFGSGGKEHCGTEHGRVTASAVEQNSLDHPILSKGELSVADVFVKSMDTRGLAHTGFGELCVTDVSDRPTKTGKTMAGEESASVSGGSDSEHSSPIWGNHQSEQHSSGSTITQDTSHPIAAGPRDSSRRETAGRIQNAPSCQCDEGYALPPMKVIYHEVAVDHSKAQVEKSGQKTIFREATKGIVDASREKRDTLTARVAKMQEILAAAPGDHFLLWHDLEAERFAIEKAMQPRIDSWKESVAHCYSDATTPGFFEIPKRPCVSVYGTQDLDEREQAIIDFSDGKIQYLAAKPVIAGSGCNFQRHCRKAIFVGIGFKFNDFIQAIHRIYRFLQAGEVEIHIIHAESERLVLRTLQEKWDKHEEMNRRMSEIIKQYGLAKEAMALALQRSMGVERVEVSGENYRAINNDCVEETAAMPENSVDLILTSIPFSTQYEYTPSYNDFGHTDDNAHFFEQMDFLTPNLLKILRPGRIAAIHVKDRIVPGGMTGLGFQTVYPFHARCIEHYVRHGFAYMGMQTIVTDVVRENNQTYRLGWTEQCKDATKMGVGMPEYLLLFRKPPSDTSNSYADNPVVKKKSDYTRSRWQIDAHGMTRSSGNRLPTPDELLQLDHQAIFKIFRDFQLEEVYDYEQHVKMGETLEGQGRLPSDFMLLQPPSHNPDVWTDVTRMLTLNGAQHAKGKEMHLCPMQFDVADRTIRRFTMPGETVFDPFGGLMTVPYRALWLDRKGIATELNPSYFLDGCCYLAAAEREKNMPTLFDMTPLPESTPVEVTQ